jgi:nucleoid DNA-binding protein
MENVKENLKSWWNNLHYSPIQKRSLAIIAALVLATSAIFIMRTSSTSQAIPTPPLIVDIAVSEITIDIQGAVLNPGVYTMTLGSRVIDAIKAGLKKDHSVQLVGFGTFKVVARKARTGVNPSTRLPMKIKASKTVRFTAGKDLKTKVK